MKKGKKMMLLVAMFSLFCLVVTTQTVLAENINYGTNGVAGFTGEYQEDNGPDELPNPTPNPISPITPKPNSPNSPNLSKLPQTGEISSNNLIFLGVILILSGYLIKKELKSREFKKQ